MLDADMTDKQIGIVQLIVPLNRSKNNLPKIPSNKACQVFNGEITSRILFLETIS
jgi:hypothetical protein